MDLGQLPVLVTVSTLFILFSSFFAFPHAKKYFESGKSPIAQLKASLMLKKNIFIFNIFALLTWGPMSIAFSAVSVNDSEVACYVAKIGLSSVYQLTNFLLYRMLLSRAALCQSANSKLSKMVNVMWWVLHLVVLPLAVLPVFMITFGLIKTGHVLKETPSGHVCPVTMGRQMLILMLVVDTLVSVVLLSIFSYAMCNPPREESKKTNRQIAWRNVFWGAVAMLSTAVNLTFIALTSQTITNILVTNLIDTLVNIFCANLIWPIKFYTTVYGCASREESYTSQPVASGTAKSASDKSNRSSGLSKKLSSGSQFGTSINLAKSRPKAASRSYTRTIDQQKMLKYTTSSGGHPRISVGISITEEKANQGQGKLIAGTAGTLTPREECKRLNNNESSATTTAASPASISPRTPRTPLAYALASTANTSPPRSTRHSGSGAGTGVGPGTPSRLEESSGGAAVLGINRRSA